MKKMEYRRPTADLILFENEDIIMTSGEVEKPKCHPWPGHTANVDGYMGDPCDVDGNGYCHKCHGGWQGLNGGNQSRSFFSIPAQDWGIDLERGFGLGDEDY